MSLSPPTDLVLEVSRAADPARAAAVKAKLAALASGDSSSGDGFHQTLGAVVGASAPPPPLRPGATLSVAKKAQNMLESAFLTQFLQEILPKDTPSAFGQGYAGDMWRSMLAERVADQIAASGRLGIADKLFAGRPLSQRAGLMSPEQMRGLRPHDVTLTSANPLSTPGGAAAHTGLLRSAPAL